MGHNEEKNDFKIKQSRKSIAAILKEALLLPPRLILSRPAVRAYLTTILLALGALFLAFVSITAYLFFYYTYLPNISFTVPIHLQFDHGERLWGVTSFASQRLASLQDYDVDVQMHLPRTPANLAAGNFMLDLMLVGPHEMEITTPAAYNHTSSALVARDAQPLAHSRRPAILTYHSRLLENAKKAAVLPLYLIGWKEEAELLNVHMMERVRFAKGRKNLPASIVLRLESSETMQVYWTKVRFTARLGGLRWLMHNHGILSFIICTSSFWILEMTFALTIWLLSTLFFRRNPTPSNPSAIDSSSSPTLKPIKTEEHEEAEEDDLDNIDTLSNTSRTFPTYSRQPPLRYSAPRIKNELDGEEGDFSAENVPSSPAFPTTAAEADGEGEDMEARVGRSDSGLGTSMESSEGSLKRRRSKKGFSGGVGDRGGAGS